MKCALFCLVAAASSAAGAQGFEGSISMTMSSQQAGRSIPVTYLIKGELLRTEITMGSNKAAMITNAAEKKMYMIMDAQRIVMVTDLNAMADMGRVRVRESGAEAKQVSITRTGKHEKVAGHDCEHVMVADTDGGSVDVCMATDIRARFQMPGGGGGRMGMGAAPQPGWVNAEGLGFPLKVTKGEQTVVEVTAIEEKKLDAAMFSPPADYRVIDAGAMMRGLRPPPAH